jgi:hypothetical protein
MTSRGYQIGLGVLIVLVIGVAVVVAQGDGDDGAASAEVRRSLEELPYRYEFEEVRLGDASAAVAGVAYGRNGATLEFAAVLGDPPRAAAVRGPGTKEVVELEEGAITTRVPRGGDSQRRRDARTKDRQNETSRMAMRIPEAICQAATGSRCPESDSGGRDQPEQSEESGGPFRTIDQGALPE